MSHTTIAIIGGGPGGLTVARLLQQSGANVTVYERDRTKEARAQGATLDLHEESGLAALQEAGLMDAFHASYRPGAEKLRVMDKNAQVVQEDQKAAGENTRPEIDRGPLQDLLLDSLLPGTVVWDHAFASLFPRKDGWRIQFQNGLTAQADIVIGADGARSKVRPSVTPVQPVYCGLTVVEGTVYQSETAAPKIHQRLQGGKIFALGDSKSLIISAKGDGSLVFYTGVNTDEQWSKDSGIDFADRAQVLAWFGKEYAGWDPVWQELFENATLPFIPRPQYYMPPDQPWAAQPNITLLGDAAHLMPPYTGEGVNMAMQDALELSRCLIRLGSNIPAALAVYEAQMRSRAAQAAREALQSTARMHSPGAMAYLFQAIGMED